MIYLFKVCMCQATFVLFYLAILRNHTFFRANRIFLLFGLTISFILPLTSLDLAKSTPIVQEVSDLIIAEGYGVVTWWIRQKPISTEGYSWLPVLKIIYIAGSLLLLLRLLINLLNLNTLSRKHELIDSSSGIKVFRTSFPQPFSFFNRLYIPASLLGTGELKKILDHEYEHARQLHSYDRVLMDFIIVFLWINPFTHVAKKVLIEIHEFEADAAVVRKSQDKPGYQKAILEIAGKTTIPGMVSFFNYSTIKRRINMMNIKRSGKLSLVRFALALPVMAGLAAIFSFNLKSALMDRLNKPTETFEFFQLTIADPVPSVFPLKSDSMRVKITSGFGMRTHPITKERQHHRGMDISAQKGTPVISSADGVVTKVGYQPEGYGHYVEVKHGEEYMTKYAQLDDSVVKVGDVVKLGDVIGHVGSSGRSTGPHLHYEVYKAGKPVDPAAYINDFQPK